MLLGSCVDKCKIIVDRYARGVKLETSTYLTLYFYSISQFQTISIDGLEQPHVRATRLVCCPSKSAQTVHDLAASVTIATCKAIRTTGTVQTVINKVAVL